MHTQWQSVPANGSGRLDVEIDGEFFNVQTILEKSITVTLVGSVLAYIV